MCSLECWIESTIPKAKRKTREERQLQWSTKSQPPIKIQAKELKSYLNGIKQAHKWTKVDEDEMQWKNKQGLMDVKCLN